MLKNNIDALTKPNLSIAIKHSDTDARNVAITIMCHRTFLFLPVLINPPSCPYCRQKNQMQFL